MTVTDGAGSISMVPKMPRSVAHRSLGGDAIANLESHKARQRMHLERCHGAAAFIWMAREWLAPMELLVFP